MNAELTQLGLLGMGLVVAYKAIDFGTRLLSAKLSPAPAAQPSQAAIPRVVNLTYDEQAARLIMDVASTLSKVAVGQERQLEVSQRTLEALDKMRESLDEHARDSELWQRSHDSSRH